MSKKITWDLIANLAVATEFDLRIHIDDNRDPRYTIGMTRRGKWYNDDILEVDLLLQQCGDAVEVDRFVADSARGTICADIIVHGKQE